MLLEAHYLEEKQKQAELKVVVPVVRNGDQKEEPDSSLINNFWTIWFFFYIGT